MNWRWVFVVWVLIFGGVQSHASSSAIGAGMTLWQEPVELKNGGSRAKMESQFKGVFLGYDWGRAREERNWRWILGADLGVGVLKGKGEANIADQFNNQRWAAITARPGWLYNTSPVSAAGVIAPVVYRKIFWEFDSGSNTRAQDVPLSLGLGFVFVTRLTETTSLQISAVHQFMWETTLWSAGLSFSL